jgi:hypothetical protein
MGSSQSDQEFHCPECGALLTVGADQCWKCRREFPQNQTAAGSSAQPAGGTAGTGGSPPFGRETRGNPLPLGENGIGFFKTLGALVIIVVAACIAFFATCFGGFFVAGSMMMGPHMAGLDESLHTGLICGGVAAVAVTVFLIWLFWLRPRK